MEELTEEEKKPNKREIIEKIAYRDFLGLCLLLIGFLFIFALFLLPDPPPDYLLPTIAKLRTLGVDDDTIAHLTGYSANEYLHIIRICSVIIGLGLFSLSLFILNRCPSCWAWLVRPGTYHRILISKFCRICGSELEDSSKVVPWSSVYTCSKGHKLNKCYPYDLNFCTHCGVQLREIEEQTGNKDIPPVIEPEANLAKQSESEATPVTQPSVDTSTLAIGNQTEPGIENEK